MIRRLLAVLCLMPATIPVTVSAATTGIQARLNVTPSHVLPGLPAMFTVAVSNRDTAPRSIDNVMRLRVMPASGPAFFVRWGSLYDDSGFADGADGIVLLAPGQTREFYFPATEVLIDGVFSDERLTVPGSYDLRMELGDGFDVLTNAAHLKVDQPTGDDLAVWQLMQKNTGGCWPVERWSYGYAATFASQYARSTYARATIFLRTPRVQLRALLPAALEGLSGPTRDDLRLLLISLIESAATEAFRAGDRKNGNDLTKQAQKQIEQLKHEAATGYASAKAEEALAEITADIAIRDADPDEKVQYHKLKPLAPCRAGDGALTFGYQNDNDWPVVIHVGNDNHFDPAPADRGQMIIFQPGKHKEAFTAALLPNETLKWSLDENTVTAPANARKCGEADDDSRFGLRQWRGAKAG